MPETKDARELIAKWKSETSTSYDQLAVMAGVSKQTVYDAITGRNKSATANTLLLNIIKMFDIK